jgi:hypothetical protein
VKIKIIEKFKDFSHRHLRLSCFLCLFLPSIVFSYYIAYSNEAVISTGFGASIEKIWGSLMEVLFVAPIVSIPIFLISLLLYTFLKQSSSVAADWTFPPKFLLVLLPAFITMFLGLFILWPYLEIEIILVGLVNSVIFATYFAIFSEVSKIQFALQCITVIPTINFLMSVMFFIIVLLGSPA